MPAQSHKGNPAHKRMSNPALKNRRARSWAAGQTRKQLHRERQRVAEIANRAAAATAWERACAARQARMVTLVLDCGHSIRRLPARSGALWFTCYRHHLGPEPHRVTTRP